MQYSGYSPASGPTFLAAAGNPGENNPTGSQSTVIGFEDRPGVNNVQFPTGTNFVERRISVRYTVASCGENQSSFPPHHFTLGGLF